MLNNRLGQELWRESTLFKKKKKKKAESDTFYKANIHTVITPYKCYNEVLYLIDTCDTSMIIH